MLECVVIMCSAKSLCTSLFFALRIVLDPARDMVQLQMHDEPTDRKARASNRLLPSPAGKTKHPYQASG